MNNKQVDMESCNCRVPFGKETSCATYAEKSERYRQYRDKLLTNGFAEAKQQEGRFFRQATEQTAFIINLIDDDDCVSVVYGFTSTAYMAGCDDWFANNGSDNESCHVRNILCIYNNESETDASEIISAFYHRYEHYAKDEILAVKKERQKAFLAYFARALKPLGFKKKGTRWTKDFGDGRALSFEAQKSAYSDQYYFNVSVHYESDFYARQSYERVVLYDHDIYNWQLMTEEQIENLVRFSVDRYIEPKLKQDMDDIKK